jgi:hypothetical protein
MLQFARTELDISIGRLMKTCLVLQSLADKIDLETPTVPACDCSVE